ncbi:hypothetical protein EDC01DRAFT_198603 [Geopyxis carbonaria]|nr:hypothetical protein EDC01DRAFT_198603 [Geopyxis carbonaria]
MTRQMMNHFTYGYDPNQELYRHASRLGPQIHSERSTFARPNPRADPMAGRQVPQPSGSITPHPTTLQSTSAGPPRRRIPVACGRCRKRKIRCSGDPGDSTGCANCKSAGITQGQCIFLRVSSSNIELSPYSSSPASGTSGASTFGFGLPHASLSTSALHTTLSSQPSLRLGNHTLGGISNSASLKSLYNTDGITTADASSPMLLGSRNPYDSMSNDMGTAVGVNATGEPGYPHYMLGHGLGETSSTQALNHSQQDFRSWPPHESTQSIGSVGHAMSTYVHSSARMSPNSNHSIDNYPMTFPALNSLSSSLPEGLSRSSLSEKSLPPLPPMPVRIQANDFKDSNPVNGGNDGISTQHPYVPSSLSPGAASRNSSTMSSASSSYVSNSAIQLAPSSIPSITSSGASVSHGGSYGTNAIGIGPNSSHNQLNSAIDPIGLHHSGMHSNKHDESDNIGASHKISPPATSLCTSSVTSTNNTYSSGEQRRGSTLNKVY